MKKWTVMVYMAGDNNLEEFGYGDIGEMKKAGSTDDVNILVEFDCAGSAMETRRYYVTKGGNPDKDIVQKLGETNTGDPQVLLDFIKWSARNYPAEHYLLVLWNHGAGWDDTNIYRAVRNQLRLNVMRKASIAITARGKARATIPADQLRAVTGRRFRRALFMTTIEKGLQERAIAFDDQAKDFLDNIETKKILKEAKTILKQKIDILGMDACLMSMGEVVWQVRESVDVTVGSEEVEPGQGWPYDTILADLVRKPSMSPQELSSVIVKRYVASYGASSNVTQSAVDVAQSAALVTAVDRLARVLSANLANSEVKIAIFESRNQVQSYATPEYIDLKDFCQLLMQNSSHAGMTAACKEVIAALGKTVIANNKKGPRVANSHGVSIYFPTRTISNLYTKLDFARKTRWDNMLKAYINAVSRRP